MSILLELIRTLPTNGEWRFNGQREKWIEAAIALVDMPSATGPRNNQIAKSTAPAQPGLFCFAHSNL